ncbi:MAG: hypothetical protein OEQ39_16110 [Gammaproteobacteria bacterium]|nr:hypothetical protein [Gammaproteobacteria bacterium]
MSKNIVYVFIFLMSVGASSAQAFHFEAPGQQADGLSPMEPCNFFEPSCWGGSPRSEVSVDAPELNFATPDGFAIFLQPNNWAQFMRPATYAQFMNPQFYTRMMQPSTMMAWMNPASYAKFMDLNSYMQMMQPGAYAQFFNPSTYLQAANPDNFTAFMNPSMYMQWMNPSLYSMPGVIEKENDTASEADPSVVEPPAAGSENG